MKTFIYKIRLSFFLKTFSISILFLLVIGVIMLLDNLGIQKFNLNAILIIGVVYFIPSLFLMVEYLIFSLKLVIQITGKEVKIYQNSDVKTYQYSDILNVTKYCSFPVSQNRARYYLSTDSYYFMKITMSDNKEYIVTSLMTDTKYNQFTINKVEPRFIASIILS